MRLLDFTDGFETETEPSQGSLVYDNSDSTIVAETVKLALDELDGRLVTVDAETLVNGSAITNLETNKIETSVIIDEDDMSTNSDTRLPTQQSVKAYVDTEIASVVGAPVGAVTMFAGSSAPTGWLLLDGSAVSRATYSELFAIISTTYGVGDGSTTFNLPDTRGIFVRGAGTHGTLTDASSTAYAATLGATQNDQMQGHHHNIAQPVSFNTTVTNDIYISASHDTGASYTGDTGNPKADDSANGTPRTGVETRPANIALNYIIKY